MTEEQTIYKSVIVLSVFIIIGMNLLKSVEPVFAVSEEPVITADSIETDWDSGITTANGNVKYTTEFGSIEAETIIYNQKSNFMEASGNIRVVLQTGVVIQSNKLTYDLNAEEAQFSDEVQWADKDGLKFMADQVNYYGNEGVAEATGEVKITNKHVISETQNLMYNLIDSTGRSGAAKLLISQHGKNIVIRTKVMEVASGKIRAIDAKIMHNEDAEPEYHLQAKELTYEGKYLYLKSILFYLKKVPLFYYPMLTLDMDNIKLPRITPRSNSKGDIYLRFRSDGPITGNLDWNLNVLLRNYDYSGFESGITWKNENITDDVSFFYYNQSAGYGVKERFVYDWPLIEVSIDGSKDFSPNRAYELGTSVIRKYWEGPLGNWQFGILGRKVHKLDEHEVEFGGVYGGYRLDYQPRPYITLSFLRLYSLEGGDYREFLDDYKIGSNILYQATVPLKGKYSLGLIGTYSFEQSLWIRQIYEIHYQTHDFLIKTGWDVVKNKPILNCKIIF